MVKYIRGNYILALTVYVCVHINPQILKESTYEHIMFVICTPQSFFYYFITLHRKAQNNNITPNQFHVLNKEAGHWKYMLPLSK